MTCSCHHDTERREPHTSAQTRTADHLGAVVGWAFYLGMSWTWIIGMFLPVLLLVDFGNPGWWIFAMPNVIGAAAMGWIVKSTTQSHRLVGRHTDAMLLFSIVTITFHGFVFGWLVSDMLGIGGWLSIGGLGLCLWLMGQWAAVHPDQRDLFLGITTFVFSLITAGILYAWGALPMVAAMSAEADPGWAGYLGLTFVCLFGFAFCPYLDLTFHRARQGLGTEIAGRRAFTLGFGLVFFAAIVFTSWYSGLMQWAVAGGYARPILPWALPVLGAYMLGQGTLTCYYHFRETVLHSRSFMLGGRPGAVGLAVVGMLLGLLIGSLCQIDGLWLNRLPGELIYLCLLSCYGMLFPAYVWFAMLRSTPATGWMILALILGWPMCGIAFFGGGYPWLIPAVALPVILGIAAGRLSQHQTPPN